MAVGGITDCFMLLSAKLPSARHHYCWHPNHPVSSTVLMLDFSYLDLKF